MALVPTLLRNNRLPSETKPGSGSSRRSSISSESICRSSSSSHASATLSTTEDGVHVISLGHLSTDIDIKALSEQLDQLASTSNPSTPFFIQSESGTGACADGLPSRINKLADEPLSSDSSDGMYTKSQSCSIDHPLSQEGVDLRDSSKDAEDFKWQSGLPTYYPNSCDLSSSSTGRCRHIDRNEPAVAILRDTDAGSERALRRPRTTLAEALLQSDALNRSEMVYNPGKPTQNSPDTIELPLLSPTYTQSLDSDPDLISYKIEKAERTGFSWRGGLRNKDRNTSTDDRAATKLSYSRHQSLEPQIPTSFVIDPYYSEMHSTSLTSSNIAMGHVLQLPKLASGRVNGADSGAKPRNNGSVALASRSGSQQKVRFANAS